MEDENGGHGGNVLETMVCSLKLFDGAWWCFLFETKSECTRMNLSNMSELFCGLHSFMRLSLGFDCRCKWYALHGCEDPAEPVLPEAFCLMFFGEDGTQCHMLQMSNIYHPFTADLMVGVRVRSGQSRD